MRLICTTLSTTDFLLKRKLLFELIKRKNKRNDSNEQVTEIESSGKVKRITADRTSATFAFPCGLSDNVMKVKK